MSRNGDEPATRSIAQLVRFSVPDDAVLLVASGGEDELLEIAPHVREFPAPACGHGASGTAAIAHLEAQRARGSEFLLIPDTEQWRLDEDTIFDRHLRQRYPVLEHGNDALLFDLRQRQVETTTIWDELRVVVARCEQELDRDPAVLDWGTGLGLRGEFPELSVFSPLDQEPVLPYADETVEIVALPSSATGEEIDEARRVARFAIVTVAEAADGQRPHGLDVEWKRAGDAGVKSAAVIAPCLGAAETIASLLFSLRETLAGSDVEVVLPHSADALENVPALEAWGSSDERVTLLELAPQDSIAAACNAGAAASGADVLAFVAPVSCPLAGWLQPLLGTFRDRPDADVVGGKVLTSHGELVHAGGELLADGSAHAAGLGIHPDAPLLSCVRVVDMVSPALLATTREAFEALDGFGSEHGSLPFLDYCARIGTQGRRAYYQPEAAVVLIDDMGSFTRHSSNGRSGAFVGAGETA